MNYTVLELIQLPFFVAWAKPELYLIVQPSSSERSWADLVPFLNRSTFLFQILSRQILTSTYFLLPPLTSPAEFFGDFVHSRLAGLYSLELANWQVRASVLLKGRDRFNSLSRRVFIRHILQVVLEVLIDVYTTCFISFLVGWLLYGGEDSSS